MTQPVFIWQRPDWPRFAVQEAEIAAPLKDARLAQGRVTGKAQALGLQAVGSAAGEIWAAEALATASIEGEKLDLDAVRSSVARRLGLPAPAKARHDRDVEGLLDMMQDAVARHAEPLTKARLFAWQAALFPTGRSGLVKIRTGGWRTGAEPMQIVSGPIGREKVHYEAPPARSVPRLMGEFLRWFADSAEDGTDALERRGDRASLVRDDPPVRRRQRPRRPRHRGSGARAGVRQSPCRCTGCRRACRRTARSTTGNWSSRSGARSTQPGGPPGSSASSAPPAANPRKRSTARSPRHASGLAWRTCPSPIASERSSTSLLDAGPGGFEGGLSAGKYQNLTSTSRQTASRDLADLVEKGVLRVTGQLKGTRYHVAVPEWR